MQLVKNVTLTKVAALAVAASMTVGLMFAVALERAHAVTLSELVELFIALDVIPADKAAQARTVLTQQGGTTTGGSTAGMFCSFNFLRDLGPGSTGADVKQLQQFLNSMADTKVSMSGAGSAGMETMYYGPATAAAVSKFQMKYSADILAPVGLTKGTGYFGAGSRAKARMLCASGTPTTPGTGTGTTTPGTGTSTGDMTLRGGEASLEDFNVLSSPSSVDVSEGDEGVKVAGFEFDVEDGDVSIKRVDVQFEETGGNAETDPWEYFESVTLWLGTQKLATMAADDEDDWEDVDTDGYELRFTNLAANKVAEGDTAELYVSIDVVSNIDDADEDAVFTVRIPDEGVRALDAAGIDQYTGESTGEERTFNFEGAGEGEGLNVSLASSNPDASVIKVDEDDQTDDQTVLVFELEAEESDIEITELPVAFTVSGGEFDELVADVELEIDGETYSDYTLASSSAASGAGTASTTFDLSDEDLVIDADDSVEVKVIVTFNKQSGNYTEGSTILAQLTATEVDAIEAEGEDDLLAADLTGTAVGETHTLKTEGVFAEAVEETATRQAPQFSGDLAKGMYTIKFEVTAFDTDVYIPASATTSASTTVGAKYRIENSSGDAVSVGTGASTTAALSSTATLTSGKFRVDEGDTETFTLSVTYVPGDAALAGYYRAQLLELHYGTTTSVTSSNVQTYTAAPAEDFETELVNIQ